MVRGGKGTIDSSCKILEIPLWVYVAIVSSLHRVQRHVDLDDGLTMHVFFLHI